MFGRISLIIPLALSLPVILRASPNVSIYTNMQNVRHIAMNSKCIACATSGGVLYFVRSEGKWRTLTMNGGLITNDIQNVAFAPDDANTLWALGVIGDYEGWKSSDRSLVVVKVNLETGASNVQAKYQPIPRSDFSMEPYLIPSTFHVDKSSIRVSIGSTDLICHRRDGRWTSRPHAPKTGSNPMSEIQSPGVFKLIQASDRIYLLCNRGVIIVGDHVRDAESIPIPRYGNNPSKPWMFWRPSLPLHLRQTPTGISCQVMEQMWVWNGTNLPLLHSRLLTLSLPTGGKQFTIVRSDVISSKTVETLSLRAGGDYRDYLHGGFLTDTVKDKNEILFATYNHIGIHANGVTRFDEAAHTWSYPQPHNGLAANMVDNITAIGGKIYVGTTNGVSEYLPQEDDWRTISYRDIPPTLSRENFEEGPVSLYAGNIIGYTQTPPQTLQIIAREGDRYDWVRIKTSSGANGVQRWSIAKLNRKTRKLESYAALGDLPDISVGSMLIQGDVIWLMGTDMRSKSKSPLVIQWDRRTNRMSLYSDPPIDAIKAIAETDAIPRPSFLSAAGSIWIWEPYGNHLLRYAPRTNTWEMMTDKAAVVYQFSSTNSIWIRTPTGTLYHWNGEEGWTRLNIPWKYDAFTGAAFYPTAEDYWFGKIGVLRVNRNQIPLIPGTP